MAEYRRLFKAKTGESPRLKGKDTGIVIDLLKEHTVEQIVACLGVMFDHGTKFTRDRQAYTLGAFNHVYNDLLVLRPQLE